MSFTRKVVRAAERRDKKALKAKRRAYQQAAVDLHNAGTITPDTPKDEALRLIGVRAERALRHAGVGSGGEVLADV